jgi:hypothetical protein
MMLTTVLSYGFFLFTDPSFTSLVGFFKMTNLGVKYEPNYFINKRGFLFVCL